MNTPTTSYTARRNSKRKTLMPQRNRCAWRKPILSPMDWFLSPAQISASPVVLWCATRTVTQSVLFNIDAPRGRHERRRETPGRIKISQDTLEALGPLRQRSRVGNGARGLQRDRRGVGILSARSRPLPRLSLERGRPRSDLRPAPIRLFRSGLVELSRSHPQGASLRADRQRRQSWRRCEGILLPPRQHSDAPLHEVPLQISAARLSLWTTAGGKPAPFERRSRV